jgi:diguanylate cyclase (GGDEF)-like protein
VEGKKSPLSSRWRFAELTAGDDATGSRASMARTGALFWAAGGIVGLISLALPGSVVEHDGVLLAVSGASLAAAALALVLPDRLPPAAFHLGAAAGTVAASLAVYAWGTDSAYGPMPYVWVLLFAFYFFSLPAALGQLALVGLGYAIALAADDSAGDHLDAWLATMITLGVGGMFVLVVRDRMSALIASLADAAQRDALTDLLNRRGFEEAFDVELERARRAEAPLSLIVGDLDRFKRINDEHGHAAGDVALKRVADLIEAAKRRVDFAARIGGEEFALLAADSDEHGAYMLAERIREDVEAGDDGLTVSFGVATFPVHGSSPEALLKAADQALYAAKRAGKNQVCPTFD